MAQKKTKVQTAMEKQFAKVEKQSKAHAKALKAIQRMLVRKAVQLHKWDPEGACSRSVACAVLDIEQAVENIDGIGMDTPKVIRDILAD